MFRRGPRTFGWEGRKLDAYFHFVGWDCLQLGLHVCLSIPNVEIHIPFGFVRIGRGRPIADGSWRVLEVPIVDDTEI